MNITSTFLPPEPEPPVVTLKLTLSEDEARDLANVAYSKIPSRFGNPILGALRKLGIESSEQAARGGIGSFFPRDTGSRTY
jgi:hypothetical protein